MFNLKIIKIAFFISFLTLSACGGGGGGGGGAAGGGTSYTVNNCSDTGTDYQTYEYYNGGSDLNQNAGNNSPLQYVCASSAYARGATGDGIQVAVVDSGLNETHSEIDANFVDYTSGSDVVNSDDDASDDNGHGSHVAGIIAGERSGAASSGSAQGVAYDAEIYGFKILDSNGDGTVADAGTAYGLIEAIGAIDIINNSWGIDADCTSESACRTLIGTAFFDNWEDVSQLATPKISVFAAGNDGDSEPGAHCQTMKYNTDISAVSVCVVATSFNANGVGYSQGKGKIATFSDYCGSVSDYCIAAPGDSIWSHSHSGSAHATKSGTSMAAPMVSGGLALIMQEFSSLTPAQVVSRLLTTATDSGEYSQSSIYGHGHMNLNSATAAVASLQTINGSNLLDDPNTSYYDLVDNSFTSSAAFANAINKSLDGKVMEVYDSFDRANFKVKVSDFFSSSSYVSQNTIENHMSRLMQKNKQKKVKHRNLYGNFSFEVDRNTIQSTLFQSAGDFLALGYNQTTNSFENAVDPLSNFFNDNPFGNKYLVNPYFYTGSGQDYFMTFNGNDTYGFDTFTNGNTSDLGLAFNFNPLSSTNGDKKYAGDLQIVLGTNYEQNKFLNSYSTGVFSTGDMSNTNFTGLKYKKNITDGLTFVGSGFAGYTYIDKTNNSYISDSTPLLTSSFTIGLAKSKFIKENQNLGFFINQPQRVEKGNINLRVPTSSDRDRTVTYSDLLVDLEPEARQINYDLVFNKSITDMSNLSANFTHVQNSDHASNAENQNFISIFYKKTF
ncbi:S8 family serine peptidase [Candidatus Pelagibacter sp.]|nr:S8 family serine peptidase [Candidatus Pelagibacter sp.]